MTSPTAHVAPTFERSPERTAHATESSGDGGFWSRLLHRWLVEYNPLYIFSAALVLGGMILVSRGLASEGQLYGPVGVAAIAELYALALIGGAALLTRLEQRRPAVMLALLTALYQCDLTLHTETSPNLHSIGAVAAAGWLVLFVAKLFALGWAMKVRVSRSAVVTATLGALGLTLLPWAFATVAPRAASAVVATWLFALASADRSDSVVSAVELDDWGRTVLRRTTRATWALWATLLGLHVAFWTLQGWISLAAILPVVPLVLTRWTRGERRVWLTVVATLGFVALVSPASFAIAALIAALTLLLRASRVARGREAAPLAAEPARGPYRAPDDAETLRRDPSEPAPSAFAYASVGRAAAIRLASGGVFALHLSAWTADWTGGPWPAHVLTLDLVLALVLVVAIWRLRSLVPLVPLTATALPLVVGRGLLIAGGPHSMLAWGAAAIGLGFAVLIGALAASWLLARRAAAGGGQTTRGAPTTTTPEADLVPAAVRCSSS